MKELMRGVKSLAKEESGKVYAWCDGRTSWNSNKTKEWIYAKLVGQEESDE